MMKVLFCNRPGGAFGYITDSMINALLSVRNQIDIEVGRWDGKRETWDAFAPDLYIGASGHKQEIPQIRSCKIALHVNPFGRIKIEPNINESKQSIDWVRSIKPDVVYGYGHESDSHLWEHWSSIAPWVPMPTAGDATTFNKNNGTHNIYDICYVGGRWDYKSTFIDKFLLPVLRDKSLSHSIRGWGTWPKDITIYAAEDQQVSYLLASCRVAPCISEPHTIATGIDLPERCFKAALSGAAVVHDPAYKIDRYIPHIVVGENPTVYYNKIKDLVHNNDMRNEISAHQRKDVLLYHTYHHRMATLLTALGFYEVASLLLSEAHNNLKAFE